MLLLAIGAMGVLQSCENRRIGEVGWKSRALLGGYFALCAAFAVRHGVKCSEALASLAGVLLAALALDRLASASGHLAVGRVEALKIRSFVVVLVAITVIAARGAGYHWGQEWPFAQTGPQLPKLDNIVNSDPALYLKYLQVHANNLWLEQRKRAVHTITAYFPKALTYSLIYLNPQQDISMPRPHWLRRSDCDAFDPVALDLLGVKYVICARAPLTSSNWQVVAAQGGQTLYRRVNYDGGIRLYCRWREVSAESPLRARDTVLQAFRDGVALVSAEDADGMPTPDPDCQSAAQPISAVDLLEDRPGRMVLSVTAERAGILVIPDNYAPGWRAWINGKEARTLKVYHAYLGVGVEPGRNTIQFVFRDNYFCLGLAISVITAIGLALYLAICGRCVELGEPGPVRVS